MHTCHVLESFASDVRNIELCMNTAAFREATVTLTTTRDYTFSLHILYFSLLLIQWPGVLSHSCQSPVNSISSYLDSLLQHP